MFAITMFTCKACSLQHVRKSSLIAHLREIHLNELGNILHHKSRLKTRNENNKVFQCNQYSRYFEKTKQFVYTQEINAFRKERFKMWPMF